MILAAPLVIPFAEAIGVSIAALGMAKATDKVNEFIQENPEQSIKIFQMIMPSQGIANALKNKSSEGDEDLSEDMDEEVEVEKDTRSKKEIVLEEVARGRAGKGNFSSPDAVGPAVSITGNVKRGLRDAGKIRKGPDPNYDASKKFQGYKRFIRPKKADGGAIGIEVLFEEKKPRKDFNIGGRATTQDFANALQRVSAGTTYQQQVQAKDYARQEASNILSQAMRSGNQSGIQSILQGIGGSPSMGGMQFNTSGNRIISIPATGPGRDKILNAMANQMLSTTTYAPPPPPTDSLTGMLESQMLPNMADGSMRSLAEQNAIRDKVLAAQKAQEQSYFMTDPVTGKKYSTEAEAIDDLGLVTYNQRFADGGRVGFFMGGPALEGPALGIYNSMKAYQSFTDQEIANAIKEAGYELPTSSTPPDSSTPSVGDNLGITNNDRSVALPIGSVTGSGLVGDYMAATQDRQNRLTNPNKVQSFINNFTGGGQADIGEMIRTGQVDTRKTSGIPLGIGSLLSQILPDKYYDMSLADQVFTQSQMGYTGPTVFGENRTGNYKDPFGLNVRSAFGNYAEAVGKNFDQLRGTLTKDREGVTFNEETGLFEGVNADAVNKQTEMIRNKYNFRKQQLGVKNVLDSQIKSAGAQREIDYAAALEKARLERIAKQQIADAEKAAKQRELQMEASAANRAEANAITNRLANEYKAQQQRDGRDFSVSGPDTSANPTGKSNQASSERGYALHGAKGGSVPTGLATMFKEKR
jgi:hypothetical protein